MFHLFSDVVLSQRNLLGSHDSVIFTVSEFRKTPVEVRAKNIRSHQDVVHWEEQGFRAVLPVLLTNDPNDLQTRFSLILLSEGDGEVFELHCSRKA